MNDSFEYVCLNNMTNGPWTGCFKKVKIEYKDLILNKKWDNKAQDYVTSFSFKCPYCGCKTLISDIEISEEESAEIISVQENLKLSLHN